MTNEKRNFWIKLVVTILSAIASAFGAQACGLSDVAAASTGFVAGSTISML